MPEEKKPDYCHILQQQGGIDAYICWDKGVDDGLTEEQRLELFSDFGRDKGTIGDYITDHLVHCDACARVYESVNDIRRTLDNINEK
jgi:hypothetical protein